EGDVELGVVGAGHGGDGRGDDDASRAAGEDLGGGEGGGGDRLVEGHAALSVGVGQVVVARWRAGDDLRPLDGETGGEGGGRRVAGRVEDPRANRHAVIHEAALGRERDVELRVVGAGHGGHAGEGGAQISRGGCGRTHR